MKTRRKFPWSAVLTCLAVLSTGPRLTADEPVPLSRWPRPIDVPQGRCLVFEPRPTTLEGDRLRARAALAVTPPDSTNTVFGIADIDASLARPADGGQPSVSNLTLLSTAFSPADTSAMARLKDALGPELARLTWTPAGNELQAGLDGAERERTAARELNPTPPTILYRAEPTVLVLLDGPPQLRALTNAPLMRVVNTPYAMLFDPAANRYWLRGGQAWYSAADWRGEWTPGPRPPAAVEAAVPPEFATQAPSDQPAETAVPRVVVATEPTELIVTRGAPALTPVSGSDLLYVSNSDQLLFFTLDSQEYYVALSGRWFRSSALTGPWKTVSADTLPPAFAGIKPGSPRSEALTYVAGTVEAREAVRQANIPQITAVARGPANLEVAYDGAPEFQAVGTTGVESATNTVDAVFLVRGTYYLCRDAVWYRATGPDGPWSVADWVPPEIQSLPPSHPHYNVKYVYVYGETPEEVYVGYVPGYSGCYVAGPTIVYGTGWWYPGYYGPDYWWAYPATFGFGFGYSSWSGWGVGVGFGYGWLGWGYGWSWGGCYPRGWWGPCGTYWACAPRYPCYRGHSDTAYRHGVDAGRRGPVVGPPRGGSRAEVRKDVPGPTDRPTNPQRRTLPTYARGARSSAAPPGTGLSRSAPRPRSEIAGAQGFSPGRTPLAQAGSTGSAGRVPLRSPTGAPVNPTPGTAARGPTSAGRPGWAPPPTATPQRPPAVSRNYASPPNPGVGAPPSAYRLPPGFGAPRILNQTPRLPQSGAVSSAPRLGPSRTPIATSPRLMPAPTRSSSPSLGSFGRAPGMRSPMMGASPPMRSGGAPSFGAPLRSAPPGGAGGISRGSPSRGAPTRGR